MKEGSDFSLPSLYRFLFGQRPPHIYAVEPRICVSSTNIPTMTTMPITVGIKPNIVPVEVSQPAVSSAIIICWVMEIAMAPSRPAIRALIIILVKSSQTSLIYFFHIASLPG